MKTTISILLLLAGCSSARTDTTPQSSTAETSFSSTYRVGEYITPSDLIRDIVEHPAFHGYGEKLLPAVGDRNDFNIPFRAAVGGSDDNIANIAASLNHLIDDSAAGLTIYYDFYSEQERQDDPAKNATGLFFYRGEPGAPFAIISPGGAFAYVASFQAGFPYAKEISDAGYNAFMLKYRTGGEQIATEDLAAAISFIFENAEELGVSTDDYSVWGSSAGGRMAANIGTEGPGGYGGDDLPRPAAVIMCCTGHSRYSKNDPPTFVVVGENDGIASPAAMKRRINNLNAVGIDTEFHVYPGLGHYFGLGIGTVAEGWIDNAMTFWGKYINE
jgi:acetyl esterase/lipase